MRRIMIVWIGIVGCLAVTALTPSFVQDLGAQAPASYARVEGWPVFPEGFVTGYVSAVDVDSHGHVFAFRRAGRQFDWEVTELLEEDPVVMLDGESGSLLAMWGADTFLVPHGLTIDHEDNVWLTDAIGHRVFKFSHDGELLMTLGELSVPGWNQTHFNAPTEVAVQPDGSFFVADGYRNSRIAKFSPTGAFLHEWGAPGTDPGTFEIPHGVDLDEDGRVWVADRENSRVQVFDPDGHFETEWALDPVVGRVANVAPSPFGGVWVVGYREESPAAFLNSEGEVEIFLSADTAGMTAVHDVAIESEDVIYVSGTGGVRKISREND